PPGPGRPRPETAQGQLPARGRPCRPNHRSAERESVPTPDDHVSRGRGGFEPPSVARSNHRRGHVRVDGEQEGGDRFERHDACTLLAARKGPANLTPGSVGMLRAEIFDDLAALQRWEAEWDA